MQDYLTKKQFIELIKTTELSLYDLESLVIHFDKEIWEVVAVHQKLSDSFICNFINEIPLDVLIKSQKVFEKTIEKNIVLFSEHMFLICRHQYLSEKFIAKHKDIIFWPHIFKYQKHLSIPFIKKFFSKYIGKNEYIKEINPIKFFHEHYYYNHYYKVMEIICNHNNKVSRMIRRGVTSKNRIKNKNKNK